MTTREVDRLLDVLTTSEVSLILTALDMHQRELTARAECARKFAVESSVLTPERRQVYLTWAADDERDVDAIAELLNKLRGRKS